MLFRHYFLAQVRSIKSKNIFLYKGSPLRDLRSAFHNARIRAKIEDFRFHHLRHCFVTNMRRAGVAPSVIMAMAGHKTEQMFHRYNVINEQDMKVALEKAGEYYQGKNYSLSADKRKGDPER